jgi:uncharacterized protein YpmS
MARLILEFLRLLLILALVLALASYPPAHHCWRLILLGFLVFLLLFLRLWREDIVANGLQPSHSHTTNRKPNAEKHKHSLTYTTNTNHLNKQKHQTLKYKTKHSLTYTTYTAYTPITNK